MHFCMDCGADISYRPPNAKRCVECAERYNKGHKSKAKKNAVKDPFLSSTDPQCIGCQYLHRLGFCNFATMFGRSRLFRHRGEDVDINAPCRERRPARAQTNREVGVACGMD